MLCSICKEHGKVPVQARGALVTRPVSNWVKATSLLKKHAQSDWHIVAVEKKALSLSVSEHGTVMEQIANASEEQKKLNRDLLKKHFKFTSICSYIEEIYDQTGDAEAHGISTLLLKYLTVATIYMLSDVIHTVAKLQGSLQSEKLDLASVPTMVTNTINRDTSTWFKNHASVFSDQGQLGHKNIKVTE